MKQIVSTKILEVPLNTKVFHFRKENNKKKKAHLSIK